MGLDEYPETISDRLFVQQYIAEPDESIGLFALGL
jgi:hypothetical protein